MKVPNFRRVFRRSRFSEGKTKRMAERINSARTTAAFSSQLEAAYRNDNLNRTVLEQLRFEIKSSELPRPEKDARLKRVESWEKRPYIH